MGTGNSRITFTSYRTQLLEVSAGPRRQNLDLAYGLATA